MLAVGVVLGREGVEGAHSIEYRGDLFLPESGNAACEDGAAAGERSPEFVVESGDGFVVRIGNACRKESYGCAC